MKIRRFFASNRKLALLDIKNSLGDDAVILSENNVTGGVEIIAATDAYSTNDKAYLAYELPILERQKKNEPSFLGAFSKTFCSTLQSMTQKSVATPWQEELSSIRTLLEQQVSELMRNELSRTDPIRAQLIHALTRFGLSDELSDQLTCYVPEKTDFTHGLEICLSLLAEQIPLKIAEPHSQKEMAMFMGSPGSGKTSIIHKLAAEAIERYGVDKIALCVYKKGGGKDGIDLQLMAKLLACDYYFCQTPAELFERVLTQDYDKILIETESLLLNDPSLAKALQAIRQEIGQGDQSIKPINLSYYLLLPVTHQPLILRRCLNYFDDFPLTACILTHLDQCVNLGSVIDLVIEQALPITYLSIGSRTSEDIINPLPCYLVEKMIELNHLYPQSSPYIPSTKTFDD